MPQRIRSNSRVLWASVETAILMLAMAARRGELSFDPSLGYLFVNVNEVGAVGFMKPQPTDSPEAYKWTSKWGEFARFCIAVRRPGIRPTNVPSFLSRQAQPGLAGEGACLATSVEQHSGAR